MIFLTLLVFLSPSAHAFFGEGTTGVRNGGSAIDCPNRPLQMTEALLAARFPEGRAPGAPPMSAIADRTEFFERAIAHLPDSIFKTFVRMRWEQYGDSRFWPEGGLGEYEVYYYRAPSLRTRYGRDGRIPATDPTNDVCAFPAYAPEDCCAQVLVSFFGEESPKPTKIAAAYARLDSYQRNILELHEAVFRAARDLGQVAPPAGDVYTLADIAKYLRANPERGELPSMWTAILVTHLVSENSPAEVEAHLNFFWNWSAAIYGPRRP